ncbi:MAG: acyl-CoA dehydratase activase [Dehalococcoidia bacterium]
MRKELTYTWTNPDIDLHKVEDLVAGVDVGSVGSKAAVLSGSEILCYGIIRTGSNSANSARNALEKALNETGIKIDDMQFTVGTGYGRANVDFANKIITEISCHARGVNYMAGPSVRTVLDMGGQDCKVIRCDEKGKAVEFLMNDKCAAGTGRGLEVISDILKIPLPEMGAASFNVENKPPQISNTCVVFARSELKAMRMKGYSDSELLAAYMDSISDRVIGLIQRLTLEKELAISGGIAKNIGIVKRIEDKLELKVLEAKPDPIIAGALGAALFARDFLIRKKGTEQNG